jgi:hypothetical protein
MQFDELKTAVKGLSVEERRKLALYILELEKEHIEAKVGPQLAEDLESVSKVLRDTFQKIKKGVKENL